MKVHEIRELNVDELNGKIKDLQDQVFRLRIQKAMGQLDTPSKMRTVRRELARLKTVLKEKR
ncbi:MAG: 50S ribosomal protein L29 [Acidobacteria bacterium]|nr:50S ribosomal protein L29 [Acidobacteriota bacterium]